MNPSFSSTLLKVQVYLSSLSFIQPFLVDMMNPTTFTIRTWTYIVLLNVVEQISLMFIIKINYPIPSASFTSPLKVPSFVSLKVKTFYWHQKDFTFIIFWVKVPVLSEQMLFAPPIVSQAAKNLTKLFSSLI